MNNRYLYLAKKLKEEAYRLDDQGQFERSISVRKREIEQLQKVGEYNGEECVEAVYCQACAYGDIGRMHFQMNRMKEANDDIEKAMRYLDLLCKLHNPEAFHGSIAMTLSQRMEIRMHLPDFEFKDILSDYRDALKYNNENKETVNNSWAISEQEKINKFLVMEQVQLRTYAAMLDYCTEKGKTEEEKVCLKELEAFITTCKYLPKEKVKLVSSEVRKRLYPDSQGINYSSNEGCYIATAVYGDYDAPEVKVLRKFRDAVLNKSIIGRLFVRIYYKCSPTMAIRLKNSVRLSCFVRRILDRIVGRIIEKGLFR